jgi:V/A-type H+-transporting ATPase subunit I
LAIKILKIEDQINKITNNQSQQIESRKDEIVSAYTKINTLNSNFAIRKYAAHMKSDVLDTYIIVGWITEQDSKKLGKSLENDTEVVYIIEDEYSGVKSKPPTKLENPKLFKPFELFTKMYGMPAYNEMDPTIFVGITYAFIFGMMFGDFGQGLVLLLGGALLYKKKNIQLAAILSFAGLFSTVFGFAYGSVFGYENAIPTMWLKPMEQTLTILAVSVAFGIGLIIVAMLINIINKVRQGRIFEALLDTNGVSGLLFYIATLTSVLLIMIGHIAIAGWLLVIFIGVPLILTAFKEPIIRFMEHKKYLIKGKKSEYLMETFFEMFEVVLSYVTNTISFVRIGAFALSHAGMMGVVHMLSETTRGQNIIILILGNILVMGLEGLIVGIQVLRLEYYEMFSRFFTAGGKEFKPYNKLEE